MIARTNISPRGMSWSWQLLKATRRGIPARAVVEDLRNSEQNYCGERTKNPASSSQPTHGVISGNAPE
jgi:hypothetical protein